MINLTISIIAGIISGLIASYLFLMYFLKNKKPIIEISQHINKSEFKGETNYFFKFINKTDSEIYDVRVEPTFYKPVGDIKGRNLRGTDIKLKDNFFMYIPCNEKDDKHNLHAIRIRTTNNLEEHWTDDSSFIRLTIMARHSLSGLNKVFTKDFHNKDCITTKKFVSGDDLSVV